MYDVTAGTVVIDIEIILMRWKVIGDSDYSIDTEYRLSCHREDSC